jgi:DNA-binding transcriptional LysR family regulator
MRSLNLDQLRAFDEVVSSGSFSAAAKRLSLTQPAVSLQVRELERRLGVRLIERVGRRVGPTEAGRDLIPHISRIHAAVAAARERMAEHAGTAVGRVRLGTGATACIYFLPPLLRDLRDRFPRLEIEVRTGNTPEILAALDHNAVDVALVTLPAAGRAFQATPLLRDEIVAVFPAEHDAPEGAMSAATLARLPLVLYEPGGNSRRIIDDWFSRAGTAPKPVMELGNIEAIKELVGAGLGCGLLPRLALRNPASRPLAARSLAPALHRQLGLVLRRDKVPDRGLREVVKALTLSRPA